MNINKLYFVEKHGEEWQGHYQKWVFIRKMTKISDLYKVDMSKEIHGEWLGTEIKDHAGDALRYVADQVTKEPKK